MLASSTGPATASGAVFILFAFAAILLMSRSNSPERYRAHEYEMANRQLSSERAPRRGRGRARGGYSYDDDYIDDDDDGYNEDRRRSRGGGLFGVFIFLVGVILIYVFSFETAGFFLMLIGGISAMAALMLALFKIR